MSSAEDAAREIQAAIENDARMLDDTEALAAIIKRCWPATASTVPPVEQSDELARLRQAVGWICDAADAAYLEDANNERIYEIFNIAAQAAGLTRRLPDEHGRFDETDTNAIEGAR